jgi:hypothetical protein
MSGEWISVVFENEVSQRRFSECYDWENTSMTAMDIAFFTDKQKGQEK